MTFIKQSAEAKYREAIKLWGKDAQVNMIIEEASELCAAAGTLIQRVMKLNRCSTQQQVNMALLLLEAEIADLEIMLEQSHFIFDGDNIRRIKHEKLQRLQKMLETSKKSYRKCTKKAKSSNGQCNKIKEG